LRFELACPDRHAEEKCRNRCADSQRESRLAESRVWPGLLRLVSSPKLDGDRRPPDWRSPAGSRLHELQADEVEILNNRYQTCSRYRGFGKLVGLRRCS
jgi:hypothetical protein